MNVTVFDVPPAVVITTCAVWVPDGAGGTVTLHVFCGGAAGRGHLAVEGGDDLTRRAQEVGARHLDGLAGAATRRVNAAMTGGPLALGRPPSWLSCSTGSNWPARRPAPAPCAGLRPCGKDGEAACAAVEVEAGPPGPPPPTLVPSVTARAPAATRTRAAATHTAISSGLRRGPAALAGDRSGRGRSGFGLVVEADLDGSGRRTALLHLAGSLRRRRHGAEGPRPRVSPGGLARRCGRGDRAGP